MSRAARIFPLLFLLLGILFALPSSSAAQSPNRAALVVRLGDGSVETACVAFNEPQITGYDLLVRSGLNVVVEVQGMGALVCSIADEGCPANDCLCQCRGGGDCVYWSYWHQQQGEWLYSSGGSSVYPIRHGMVDGWSWGPGAVSKAVPPPEISFTEICGVDEVAIGPVVTEMRTETAVSPISYAFFAAISLPLFLLVWRANRKTAV
jgi:hypothetical protein